VPNAKKLRFEDSSSSINRSCQNSYTNTLIYKRRNLDVYSSPYILYNFYVSDLFL